METQDPAVLAFVFDLFFVSRVESVAEHIGLQVDFWEKIENPPAAKFIIEALQKFYGGREQKTPDLILIDLSTPGLPWEAWLTAFRSIEELAQLPIIAFGSHVQVDILARARAAGATEALAKSRFTSGMPQIFQKYL